MNEELYIVSTQLHNPSGLGEVARNSLSLGKFIEFEKSKELKNEKILYIDCPHFHVLKENKSYIWTVFEGTLIHDSWVKRLNCFEKIFTTHKFLKKSYETSGVTTSIDIVPQGFKRLMRTKSINKQSKLLKLGMFGFIQHRKNCVNLIDAVEDLIAAGFSIELNILFTYQRTLEQIEELLEKYKENPYINLNFENQITDDELAEWYSTLDVYIYPSKGEGWSMTPRESMYMGIPTIVSDIPVHDSLVESGFCTVIENDGWEEAYYEFFKEKCGQWNKIPKENIKKSIIDVYNNYDEKLKLAEEGSKWISDKWKWEDSINKIREILK